MLENDYQPFTSHHANNKYSFFLFSLEQADGLNVNC